MILDMMCHWRYVLDNLFGEVKSISCLGATHIPQRWDERASPTRHGRRRRLRNAELVGHDGEPVVAQLNMSWATRVRRDDLVTFHVDGTHGSAVAGLTACGPRARVNTPRPVWNPDDKQTMNFFDQWQEVPDTQVYDNGFKIQWEHFIRHVVENAPYSWTAARRRQGRAAGGSRAAKLEGAPLDRRAGAEDLRERWPCHYNCRRRTAQLGATPCAARAGEARQA